jgi:Predicted permease
MEWVNKLIFSPSIAQCVLVLAFTIFVGKLLAKIKIKGISLGITWILFVGIIISHFGIVPNETMISFIKDFGLILFVYSIGLQVGPGFFASLKKGGLKLNMMAVMIILLGCLTTYIIHLVSGENISTMVGIMSGAITNTPALGAAQQTLTDMGKDASVVPLGYAVAYPLGVIGIIFSPLIVKWIFRINVKKEEEEYLKQMEHGLIDEQQSQQTTQADNHSNLVSHRIVITKSELNGQRLGQLNLSQKYNITIKRIYRGGLELKPAANLCLQLGDRLTVLGNEENISKVASLLGNSMKRLDTPNILGIFLGIFLGIILGSIPIFFPGMPQPVKLGLAGGPLIVAILMARYGPYYKVVTFVTSSANMMIREIGIALFLAAVGLSAGAKFISTVVNGGYLWIIYGVIITLVPLLLVGIFARVRYKMSYYTIAGFIAGSTTDPPALAYVSNLTEADEPSVAYATVYPLTMFLRVLCAQIMILMFV